MRRALLASALLLTALTTALPAQAQTPASQTPTPQTPTQRIRGSIVGLEGTNLVVATREGPEARIVLASNYEVTAVIPATLADIKPGTYIGTAAVGPKDRLRALEVLIFPEAMRGTGEGHRPWDLVPESTMTNATVENEVSSTNGRDLTLKFGAESLKVAVPPDAPIVTFEPGSKDMLKPGTKVIITATRAPDGTLSASRVAAGKNGLTPPM